MTILIDDALATSFLTVPVREGWIDNAAAFRLVPALAANDISEQDIALVPAAVATLLVRTHVIDRSVAVIHDGIGMTTMWTPVRPDELDEETVYLQDAGVPGETLARALLQPYFGITPVAIEPVDAPPEGARVVVSGGVPAFQPDGSGFREDLARAWFILTGQAVVSHVLVVGVRALAQGTTSEIGQLLALVEIGHERRRDIRRMVHEATGADRDALAEVTNRMRFRLEPDDIEPARRLVVAGTSGTGYGRSLPALRDQLPDDATQVEEGGSTDE